MITLDDVKAHLNIDHDLDNDLLDQYIRVSFTLVEDTLGYRESDFSINEVPEILVEQAQRILVAEMYRDRELTTTKNRYNTSLGLNRLLSPYSKIFIV